MPLDSSPESFDALRIACRLAVDDRARIDAVVVIEVPALLPSDAHFDDEDEAARRLLERAGATGDGYGVKVVTRVLRARDFGAAIASDAISNHSDAIVIGVGRDDLEASPRRAAPDPVLRILDAAPCRVMVVSAPVAAAA